MQKATHSATTEDVPKLVGDMGNDRRDIEKEVRRNIFVELAALRFVQLAQVWLVIVGKQGIDAARYIGAGIPASGIVIKKEP